MVFYKLYTNVKNVEFFKLKKEESICSLFLSQLIHFYILDKVKLGKYKK